MQLSRSFFLWSSAAIHFALASPSNLQIRADCSTTTVKSGDGCGTLASRCGISANDFNKYNPDPNLCSSLTPGQLVCCSSGTLPDRRPKQNSDGSCASYIVQDGDSCSKIAASYGLTVGNLSVFNDGSTWGWTGCAGLQKQASICVSTGSPPLPAPVTGTVCGPQVPGTQKPTDGTKLADLNPCPLNACCDKFGQCGITPEFCTASNGPTNNPGTSAPGQNGCISNCGVYIANMQQATTQVNVAYYEAWNWAKRGCNNMHVRDIDPSVYTHVHWAFLNVDPDSCGLSVGDGAGSEWSDFLNMKGLKRIVSIGGWGFSTEPATYNIIRGCMHNQPKNFAQSIVNFISYLGLDGIDIDWEYPGAPGGNGMPAGQESDAYDYYVTLLWLRKLMPSGKTISMAMPASYWYLKGFKYVGGMGQLVDYIVYMTYDLAGQWNYDNKWAADGCPSGRCLRSHVNMTETGYALSMITKAGVPTNKVVVGISSYGRSFRMDSMSCDGPMCTFQGPESRATPGICTNTPGILSNAEIQVTMEANYPFYKSWHDEATDSDYLVYGDSQWVAYMSDATKKHRKDIYRAYQFLGTSDWAVDLQHFSADDGDLDDSGYDEDMRITDDLVRCDKTYTNLDDLDKDAASIPDTCTSLYSLQALAETLRTATNKFNDLMNNDYDAKFKTFSSAMAGQVDTTVHDFIMANGNKYFTCKVQEFAFACSCCKDMPAKMGRDYRGDACKYCHNERCYENDKRDIDIERSLIDYGNRSLERSVIDGGNGRPEKTNPWDPPEWLLPWHVILTSQSEPCAPDESTRGYMPNNVGYNTNWTLRSDKADQFYADLQLSTGVKREHTKISGRQNTPYNNDHGFSTDLGIVVPTDFTPEEVPNPKDTVLKALANSNELQKVLDRAVLQMRMWDYDGDDSELVDAVAIPILMVVDAVDQMQKVEDAADKIDAAKRKTIIMAVFGALLFFIPIAGEVIGAVAGIAEIATVVAAVAVAGDLAMGIYTVVSDKESLVAGILQIIMAPLGLSGLGGLGKISQAASLRRAMQDADLAGLGARIAGGTRTLQKVVGVCKRI